MNFEDSDQAALEHIRQRAKTQGCRLEISSDEIGALGELCCVASNSDRSVQGFGKTPEEAFDHFRRGGYGRAERKIKV
jgi:hypothetical protein